MMTKFHKVLTNIPEEFVVEKTSGGTTSYFPKFGGLMYLANTMGKPIISTRNISTKADEVVFECNGYLIPNKATLDAMGMDGSSPLIDMWKMPTVTHGTANAKNLNSNMMPHATVMAETRAIVRCLRILTGCSYTSYEEMQESDFNGNTVGTNSTTFKPISASEMLLQETDNMSREELIKAIAQLMTKQPYKGIIDLYCKEKKIAMFTGLDDASLKELHRMILDKLKGQ